MRSGNASVIVGIVGNVGSSCYYWTNLSGPNTEMVYFPDISPSAINLLNRTVRYNAFPVQHRLPSFLPSYVRSGFVSLNYGILYDAGLDGDSWATLASSSGPTYARRLRFNVADVNPSNDSYRWDGFPIRCTPGIKTYYSVFPILSPIRA